MFINTADTFLLVSLLQTTSESKLLVSSDAVYGLIVHKQEKNVQIIYIS